LQYDFDDCAAAAYEELGGVASETGEYAQTLDYRVKAAESALEVDDYNNAGVAYDRAVHAAKKID
jgi:hypothetical protein